MTDCEGFGPNNLQRAPSSKRGREHDDTLRAALETALRRDDLCDETEGEHHTDEYVAAFLVALDTELQRAALAASATDEAHAEGWPHSCPTCRRAFAASATDEHQCDDPTACFTCTPTTAMEAGVDEPDGLLPSESGAYRLALMQIEHYAKVIDRLTRALRVANHKPHDQDGEPVEGFPTCSECGAIQTDASATDEGPRLSDTPNLDRTLAFEEARSAVAATIEHGYYDRMIDRALSAIDALMQREAEKAYERGDDHA